MDKMEHDFLQDDLRVFVVPVDILNVPDLTTHEKLVYVILRSFANPHKPEAFPSYETIARMGSMTRRHAINCMKGLIAKGLIHKEERFDVTKSRKIRNASNLYKIKTPKIAAADHQISEPDSPPLVNTVHQGSEPDSPPLVNTVHQGSEYSSPEQNHLTKSFRTISMNNNTEPVAAVLNPELDVVKTQIESALGTSIKSLLPQLKKWVEEHGADALIEKARFIGASKTKWKNIIGTYRTSVIENWDTSFVTSGFKEVAATFETRPNQDERYSAFYQLFPDA